MEGGDGGEKGRVWRVEKGERREEYGGRRRGRKGKSMEGGDGGDRGKEKPVHVGFANISYGIMQVELDVKKVSSKLLIIVYAHAFG